MFETPQDQLLDKQTCLDVFRTQHQIMMSNIEQKGEDIAKNMQPPKTQEEHKSRIEKSMVQQCREVDDLFLKTNIEPEVLDASIEACKLNQHPDF